MLEVKFYKDGEEYRPTPIEVAAMLIQTKEKRKMWKDLFTGVFRDREDEATEAEEVEVNMFLPFELDEIAKHLQVYTEKCRCHMSIQNIEGSVNEDE